jgi:hypothetical protein
MAERFPPALTDHHHHVVPHELGLHVGVGHGLPVAVGAGAAAGAGAAEGDVQVMDGLAVPWGILSAVVSLCRSSPPC